MKKDSLIYLKHIIEAIEKIQSYTRGIEFSTFEDDFKTQDAVFHKLSVIGEASKQITPEVMSSISGVPWSEIIALRNKIIHEYFGIDLQLVWNIVVVDLPKLYKSINDYLVESHV